MVDTSAIGDYKIEISKTHPDIIGQGAAMSKTPTSEMEPTGLRADCQIPDSIELADDLLRIRRGIRYDVVRPEGHRNHWKLAIALFLLMILGGGCDRPQPTGSNGSSPISGVQSGADHPHANAAKTVASSTNTDEREFLVYAYRKLRAEFHGMVHSRIQAQERLDGVRDRANRYAAYAKDRQIDGRIESLFTNLVSAIDATSDYFRQLDRIDRGILTRKQDAAAESGFNAGFAGASTGMAAYDYGASGEGCNRTSARVLGIGGV